MFISKAYIFKGDRVEQNKHATKLRNYEEAGMGVGRVQHYDHYMAFDITASSQEQLKLLYSSYTELVIGSMEWRFEFENPNEIYLKITSTVGDPPISVIEKIVSNKLYHVEADIYRIIKPKETRSMFLKHLKRDLPLVDDTFFHNGKQYTLIMIDPPTPKIVLE